MKEIGIYKRPREDYFYGKDIDRRDLITRQVEHYQILSQIPEDDDEVVISIAKPIDKEEEELDFLQAESEKLRLDYISKEIEKKKEALGTAAPISEQKGAFSQTHPAGASGSLLDIKA